MGKGAWSGCVTWIDGYMLPYVLGSVQPEGNARANLKGRMQKPAVNSRTVRMYLTFRLRLDLLLDFFPQLGICGVAFTGWHLRTLSSFPFLLRFLCDALLSGSLRVGRLRSAGTSSGSGGGG